MTEQQTVKHQAGICWISEDQWSRFLEITEDADRLEQNWQEWAEKTDEMIATFAEKGIHVIKVPVDLDELLAWCDANERPLNGNSRAEYVTKLMTNHPVAGETRH